MSGNYMEPIRPASAGRMRQWQNLLARSNLSPDPHLEYTVGLFGEGDRLLATGSAFRDTLRCLAVDAAHQGEGLLNQIVSHLTAWEAARGNTRLYLYTKPESVCFFESLGYGEVERVPEKLAFLENAPGAFETYLRALSCEIAGDSEPGAAVVMNANPFTRGHLHLVKRACEAAARVEVFVLSEELSLIPFSDRIEMVRRGCAGLSGVTVRPSGSYIISAATFPSYFLRDSEAVTRAHARLDARIFTRIARALRIGARFVGEEPFSESTRIYNEELSRVLPKEGVRLEIVPRLEAEGRPVSATDARALMRGGRLTEAEKLLPPSTLRYLTGPAGEKALAAIRAGGLREG